MEDETLGYVPDADPGTSEYTDLAGEEILETEISGEGGLSGEEAETVSEVEESMPDPLEGETLSEESVVVVPPSSLDVENLTIHVSEGVLIEGLLPQAEEEEVLPVAYAGGSALSLVIPDNRVVFTLGSKQLVFPSGYVDDLVLVDGYLLNMGSPVTISVNLSETASVSNYIISQVTFPTYGSSDYITYVTSYGSPYRIVDRYRNTSGTISSYTRTSSAAMMSQEIVQPAWYGFSGGRMYGYMFALVLIFILIWGRMRWKR